MQDTQTSGGAVSAIPATLGDVAIVSSSSARLSHCHTAEDVMGLDDRIEAKRLEAMPEIVIEDTFVATSANGGKYFGVGAVIPAGLYVGRTTATMEVLSGTVSSGTNPRCWLNNAGLIFIVLSTSADVEVYTRGSSGASYPGDTFLMFAQSDVTIGNGSNNRGAYMAVSNAQANSSYEVTGRVELKKLL